MIFCGSVVRMVIFWVMAPFTLVGGANVSEKYTASVFRAQLREVYSIFVTQTLVITCQTTGFRMIEGHKVYCLGEVYS